MPVRQGRLIFHGVFLGSADNAGDRTRWAQLVGYRGFGVSEASRETYGREYYLLHAIGHSRVVHSPDGCQGKAKPVRDFCLVNEDCKDLEPCPDCRPDFSSESPPDAVFKIEVTRYSHTRHLSAEALVGALRKCADCGHSAHEGGPCRCGCKIYAQGEISQIGQRLLEKMQAADPQIAAAVPAEICL